jgi:hypothetical protein
MSLSDFFDLPCSLSLSQVINTVSEFSSVFREFCHSLLQESSAGSDLPRHLCIPPSPGFPGTLFTTVFQLSSTAPDIARLFLEFCREFDSEVDRASANASRIFSAQCRLFEHPRPLEELRSLVLVLNTAGERPMKEAKAMIECLWGKYVHAMALTIPTETGGGLPRAARAWPFECVGPVFAAATVGLKRLGDAVACAGRALRQVATTIDFPCDFTEFVRQEDLKWVDVSPPPFERFKFASRFACPDVIVIERFTIVYFPVGMARAKADFTPEAPDELVLTKGTVVWLMQQPKEQWVLAMAKVREQSGFVPTAFVEPIGVALAAVLPGAVGVRSGMLVAVIKERPRGRVLCEKADGRKIDIAREKLAIL